MGFWDQLTALISSDSDEEKKKKKKQKEEEARKSNPFTSKLAKYDEIIKQAEKY